MKKRQRFGRDAKIVLVTVGITSLAWLLFFAFWMQDRVADDTPTAARIADIAPVPRRSQPAGPLPQEIAGRLAIPVAGIAASQLTDTFTAARAGGARSHDAIDIMAPAGTPVLAAGNGTVAKIFWSDDGGKTIYIRTPAGGEIHYYAHLRDYAPGLREGQQVRTGQRLGTVGSSGNADPAAPHLHFAVMRMAPGEDWYEGSAVNPYPLLTGPREPVRVLPARG